MESKCGIRLAAALVPLLMLTAACGGSGDETTGPADKPKADSQVEASQEPTGPALSEAQLKKALLAKSDIKGYEAEDPKQQPLRPTTDKTECLPLADVTGYGTEREPAPKAFVSRNFGASAPDQVGLAITDVLMAYEGEDAASSLAQVRTALKACGGGFKTTNNNGGQTVAYVSVKEQKAPTGGDEAVAFQLVGEANGQKIPLNFAMVRSGSTVLQFMSLHLTEQAGAPVPQNLVDAQLAKLDEAAGA